MEKNKWRPQDYFGWSETNGSSMAQAMKKAVDEIKEQAELKAAERSVLREGESPVNQSLERRMKLMKEMGNDDYLPKNYNEVELSRQNAIKSLGWEKKNGMPVLDEKSQKELDDALLRMESESTLNDREKMILDAMTDWKAEY